MPVFALSTAPNASGEFQLTPEQLKHWVKARRAQIGETFDIWLPSGERARAAFFMRGKTWWGKVSQTLNQREAPLLPLHLGIGWIRWPRLEWLVEKLTELGVVELSLLKLQHARYQTEAKISAAKMTRLQRIAQNAATQCERFTPLIIHPPRELKTWLKYLNPDNTQRFLLLSRENAQPLSKAKITQTKRSACLIGPEGGFTSEETQLALDYKFSPISLGERILRSETAAIAVASILLNA